MIVVTDNGALGHLIQIDRADLLPRLYGRVLIPPAVMREFAAPETPETIREWVKAKPTWAEVVAPLGEPDFLRPGAGEREAIRLAKENDALLLCDDARAVKRGRREGLLVTGTLGVLQLAHAKGWLDIVREIELLRRRTTLRLPEDRLPTIIATAEEMRRGSRPNGV